MGGDPEKVNPLLPAELVIDHSVQVDEFGHAQALTLNGAGKLDITTTKLVLQPSASSKPAALADAQNQALFGRTHNAGSMSGRTSVPS